MVDPLDKIPTRLKTYHRIFEFFRLTMFQQQNSEVVNNGCALSMVEILVNVFPEYLTIEN